MTKQLRKMALIPKTTLSSVKTLRCLSKINERLLSSNNRGKAAS